jgi:hypothetical protein
MSRIDDLEDDDDYEVAMQGIRLRGKSPHFALDNFNGLTYEEEASFLESFLGEGEVLAFPLLDVSIKTYQGHEGLHPAYRERREKQLRFMQSRVILTTDEWIFSHAPGGGLGGNQTVHWYAPRSLHEIMLAIEDSPITFTCIVLEQGRPITDYRFMLDVDEHCYIQEEDEEYRTLFVTEKYGNRFLDEIVPELKSRFAVFEEKDPQK